MKIFKLLPVVSLIVFALSFSSCGNDDDAETFDDLGTFVGHVQVTDDPQTELGYIFNASLNVKRSGSKIIAHLESTNPPFERDFSGSIISSSGNLYNIEIDKQTKPVEKIVSSNIVISDNLSSFNILIASDNITVK